ncbi:MAG: mechanosensitive ion channel [Xanthomonadales bacterium]|nr:mechanosensitive ion channel [Xanthomonadales bacterium]
MEQLFSDISTWLTDLPPYAVAIAGLLALLLVGLIADRIIRPRLLAMVRRLAKGTRSQWDDMLVEHKVFARVAETVPAVVIYFGAPLVPELDARVMDIIRNVALAYLALMVTLALGALLSAVNAIYKTYPISRERPLTGFIQVAKIAIYVLGGVVVISALIDKSPLVLLTGFGAMTAILLLVFKDTILSLVASVQLTSLDMVRVGDWIEMPQYNADGDVIDVALHTVKVQNWDKTITTVPTHKLISESFRNWRGMSESGGRRIKRSLFLDVSSVRFLSEDEVERFKEFALLKGYIEDKQRELAEYNARIPDTANVNLRRLTNLGTFRAYLFNYLKHHPEIHDSMTLLVRQLQPGPTGIPIEVYAFTRTTAWGEYERIQADIFDHILAQCSEFGLRVFQQPSGADLDALGLIQQGPQQQR